MDNLRKDESYYDLLSNMTFIRGYKNQKVEDVKFITHPDIFQSVYSISKDGHVYCIMNDQYLKWDHIDKYPSVNLLKRKKEGEPFIRDRFLIKDLMAYSYIANAKNYLERGCKIVNIDGNPDNCNYHNIIFLEPEEILKEK